MINCHVNINYRTLKGNPASKNLVIQAKDLTEALRAGEERVRRYKRFLKMDNASSVELKVKVK